MPCYFVSFHCISFESLLDECVVWFSNLCILFHTEKPNIKYRNNAPAIKTNLHSFRFDGVVVRSLEHWVMFYYRGNLTSNNWQCDFNDWSSENTKTVRTLRKFVSTYLHFQIQILRKKAKNHDGTSASWQIVSTY